jgi:septal ring factor EnvC (AmiA/AmiB activator)
MCAWPDWCSRTFLPAVWQGKLAALRQQLAAAQDEQQQLVAQLGELSSSLRRTKGQLAKASKASAAAHETAAAAQVCACGAALTESSWLCWVLLAA